MNAFEFGYVVGSLEKQAARGGAGKQANTALAAPIAGSALVGGASALAGAMNAPAGHRTEGALRGAVTLPGKAMGGALGAGVGGLVGVGNMGFRGLNSVARGVDSGISAGTSAMDKLLGGRATGIGGKMLRVPAQALGAAGGAALGTVRAPFSALGGVAHDTYQGARKGVNLMGRLQDATLPAPSYAGKEAGIVGDMVQNVKDKTKQVADKATATAKTVSNKAVDAGKKMQTNFESWRKSK